MASTAISAQGSTLHIGTGSGSAKTISGVALGNPTILTATGHGFNVGDRVTIASVGGATTVNGAWSVKFKTANTFAIELDTTGGSSYTSGGTATPVTWSQVKNLATFNGFDGSASEIDRSNMDSVAKEFLLGLVDNGSFTVGIDYDYADAGQAALLAKQVSGIITDFKLTLPDTRVATFTAYVKKLPIAGGVDQKVRRDGVELRISGAVSWA